AGAGGHRRGVTRLLGRRREPELERRGREAERVSEGQELRELRALDPLGRKAPRGEEPARLATVGAREADALADTRGPGDERALDAPPEVEGHLVALAAHALQERQQRADATRALEDVHAVEPRVAGEKRRRAGPGRGRGARRARARGPRGRGCSAGSGRRGTRPPRAARRRRVPRRPRARAVPRHRAPRGAPRAGSRPRAPRPSPAPRDT